MIEFINVTEARKKLYKIIDECSNNDTSFVLTSKGKAVRVLDERRFQEIILSRRIAEHPEILKKLDKASKELKDKAKRK